jgi:NADH-quinone oxidoreductase subunit C
VNKEELKSYLETTFPGCKVGDTFDFPQLIVDKNDLLSVASKLKDSKETQFDFLFCQTAVDRTNHFEVVYHLTSTIFRHDMVLKVLVEERENAAIESVCSLWQAAEFFENEIWDMFGIKFLNHPNLRRFILGEDWNGFPLRKDYTDEKMLIK